MNRLRSFWSTNSAYAIFEWRWAMIYAIFVMAYTSLPYFIAFQQTLTQTKDERWRFSGFVFNLEDGNSYIAKMRRGMEGEWLFRSPYSGMAQKGVIAFFPYYILGKLAGGKATHTQLVLLFHWFRIGAGIFYILTLYRFLCEFLKRKESRQYALVLSTLGGGLGWLMLFFPNSQSLPLEFYSPEAFGFLSLYGLPHLSLARAFLLSAMIEYLRFWKLKDTRQERISRFRLAIYWLCAGLSQPIHAGILGIVLAFDGMIRLARYKDLGLDQKSSREKIISLALAAFPAVALLAYTAIRFLSDPYLQRWAAQNQLPPATIPMYLVSYGWLLPFVMGEIFMLWKKGGGNALVPMIWLGTALVLNFVPVSIQRRLIEGIWILIVLFTIMFLEALEEEKSQRNLQRMLRVCLLVLSLPASFLLIWGGVQQALAPNEPLFLPERQAVGYEALDRYAPARDAIVLASYETSNALPAFAFVRVVLGHGPESPYVNLVSEKVKTFYQAQTPLEFRLGFLRQYQIQYVFWGENEKDLGDWQPKLESFLKPIYETEDVVIFEVDQAKLEY